MPNTYLVTGANKGIGLEFARQLAARGERVIATARRPGKASELASLGVRVEALDVDAPASVAGLAERLGDVALDVLINNAGVYGRTRALEELDEDELVDVFRTNAAGPLRVVRALLPSLRRGAGKRIVNVTSRMGSIADNSSGGSYAYRASKAALNALTRSLALDLAPAGFACVVVHPGWVQTDMGGAGAPLTTAESVTGLMRVIDGMDAEMNGRFFDYSGTELPW